MSSNGYARVKAAREPGRLTASDFIKSEQIFTEFFEMHGDRCYADDPAVITGVALLEGRPVTLVGLEKGHDTNDRIARNFGSAHPDGYRKALRQMQLAEKFGRPIVTFVDTSGAYCGIEAEERGESYAIARNLAEMMALKVPVVSIVIGEGGSGGALGIAVANEVWMLENAYYSVVSPEGCASILWKDAKRAEEAADCLKLTAADLHAFGVVERVFEESTRPVRLLAAIKAALCETLDRLCAMGPEALARQRYEKFRAIGSAD